jgi:hypothetical protein
LGQFGETTGIFRLVSRGTAKAASTGLAVVGLESIECTKLKISLVSRVRFACNTTAHHAHVIVRVVAISKDI